MILAPGSALGSYRVLAHLASAVASEFYAAESAASGDVVRLRVLAAPLSPSAADHFERLQRVRSPHVETLHEVRSAPDATWLAFEDVERAGGRRLSNVRQTAWGADEGLRTVQQIGEGLLEAHRHGLVCGILDTESVWSHSGDATIRGLGSLRPIAWPWRADGSLSGRTADSDEWRALGLRRRALAPEHLAERALTTATDVFLLARLAIELLLGHEPFPGDGDEAPASVVQGSPELPPVWDGRSEVRSLFLAALDADPSRRVSLVELLRGVQRLLAGPPAGMVGRYQIVEEESAGDAGSRAFYARDPLLGRDVRVTLWSGAGDPGSRQRFLRTVQAWAGAGDPHLAAVQDAGEHDGAPYVVTEYEPGRGLDLLARARYPSAEALGLAADACRGLAAAHEAGLAWGPLALHDFFVSADGLLKLGRFRPPRIQTQVSTRTGIVMGFPDMASPEHVRGTATDARSDVFSLGCLAYRLLTGRMPFAADSFVASVFRILQTEPAADGLPGDDQLPGLRDVLARALAKDPVQRFQTASEMADALDAVLRAARRSAAVVTSPPPLHLENVQFTAYRPRAMQPLVWYPLLVFTHLTEAGPGGVDPIQEVERQAQGFLSATGQDPKAFLPLRQDATLAIPRESRITLQPDVPGLTFNPPFRTFAWIKDLHREEFDVMAEPSLLGQTATGRLTVYYGALILADVPLSIPVRHEVLSPAVQAERARPYDRIFACYSHADTAIVEQVERCNALGHQYLRDVHVLRSGERWSERLLGLIEEADLFQLFWSPRARASAEVTREWTHALGQGRQLFVRPCFWERPMAPVPPALQPLHFQFLPIFNAPPETRAQVATAAIAPPVIASFPAPPAARTDSRPVLPPSVRDSELAGSSGVPPYSASFPAVLLRAAALGLLLLAGLLLLLWIVFR